MVDMAIKIPHRKNNVIVIFGENTFGQHYYYYYFVVAIPWVTTGLIIIVQFYVTLLPFINMIRPWGTNYLMCTEFLTLVYYLSISSQWFMTQSAACHKKRCFVCFGALSSCPSLCTVCTVKGQHSSLTSILLKRWLSNNFGGILKHKGSKMTCLFHHVLC